MDADKFQIATLDVREFKPEEITCKVENGKIKVSGLQRHESEEGFDSKEFRRCYNLPEGVDESSISTRIAEDGMLHVEALKKSPPATTENKAPATKDDTKFTLALDVSDFKPEEVDVKVYGHELSVRARQECEEHGFFTARQFNRHFVLPREVDMDTLVPRLAKDGVLYIEADKRPLRQLDIVMEK
ncbi:alpha-crystallin B chain [Nematostella vectensis]|nr:alpha-crystallin B chain [Nematostella vectensis]